MVVQNCCNCRSKKYRKWHFWGCSLSETLQRINIKVGRYDYVGDGSQYAKWHINRFRGVISAKGWNRNGLCFFNFFKFFVCSLAPLGSNRWTNFDEWFVKMRVSGGVAFLLGLEQWRGLGHVTYYLILGPPYYLQFGWSYKRQILQPDRG